MATQVNTKPAGKHDAFISGQLARAEQRIRLVDLATGLAGFVAGTLLYAVGIIVLDRLLTLPAGTRQVLLLFYVVASGLYLYLAVVRPLRWRVNPLYAARQLEQTLPGQRNHLVNWIDLRDEKLPAAFRTSLGQRTAKDLAKTDVDQAISNRRAWVAAGGVGTMGVVLIVLIQLFGPRPFGSLLARAINPFGAGTTTATRTQITLIQPASGDLVVTIGKPVTVVAHIEGWVPAARDRAAACLLYRQDPSEPYRKRYLQFDESGRDWVASVAPIDVGNGFTYKVTAGDAETPEYRVTTRAAPLIADFLATYHYRPYVGRADRAKTARKLDDLRGTEVSIVARTNRILKSARLDFEAAGGGGDILRGELRADDPRAMRFRLVLDRPGKYRLRFTSTEAEGETYADSIGHDIAIQPDLPPVVRMTQPEQDVQVPADGHVALRGEAADDIGIAAVALRMRIVDGPVLQGVPYLADKLGKADFGTPRQLDYRELIELPRLRDEAGKPIEVKPGMVIECWLEARDACDFPRPNVGESTPKRRIIVTAAKNDVAEQKKRDQARQEKAEHEKKQQDDLKKQKAAQEEQRKQDEADERAEKIKREQQQKGKEGKTKGKNTEPKKEEAAKQEQGQDDKTRKTAEEIEKALKQQEEKQARENDRAGEGKGPGKDKNDQPKPGQGKESGPDKAAKEDKPGAGRDQGKKDDKNAAGEKRTPARATSPRRAEAKASRSRANPRAKASPPGRKSPGINPDPANRTRRPRRARARKREKARAATAANPARANPRETNLQTIKAPRARPRTPGPPATRRRATTARARGSLARAERRSPGAKARPNREPARQARKGKRAKGSRPRATSQATARRVAARGGSRSRRKPRGQRVAPREDPLRRAIPSSQSPKTRPPRMPASGPATSRAVVKRIARRRRRI